MLNMSTVRESQMGLQTSIYIHIHISSHENPYFNWFTYSKIDANKLDHCKIRHNYHRTTILETRVGLFLVPAMAT